MGRALLLWGGGSTSAARTHAAAGGVVLAWPGSDPAPLAAAGVASERVQDALGPDALAAIEAAPRRWARVWARVPLAEGRSFRELVPWRGESLLWAAEGFLRQATAGPRCARSVELCLRLLEALEPAELDASGLSPADTALLARTATACGVLFHGTAGRPAALPVAAARHGGLRERLFGARPAAPPGLSGAGSEPRVLLLLSAPGDEAGLAALLDALRADASVVPVVLPVATLRRFETKHARQAADAAVERLRALYAALHGTPALAAAYSHRGVVFADLAAGDLEALLCAHLPPLVRQLERAVQLLECTRPAAVLLRVEQRDERRALGMAAHVSGVPWLVLERRSADEPHEPERSDFGPQPLAALPADDLAATVAAVRAAMRGSVGTP